MAYIGSSPTKVVSRQSANIFTYTAVANQVAFTGSDANGNTLACTPSDIMVHMNGLRLEESDFTATTTTVTLGSGAAAGDEVTITAFVTFETADAYTKSASDTRYVNTTGDSMTGDLTVDTNTFHVDVADNRVGIGTSTPAKKLHISESAAAGEGILLTNDNNVANTYSDIKWQYAAVDASYASGIRFRQLNSSHGGQLEFYTDNASGAYTKQMQITENGHVTMPNQPSFAATRSQGAVPNTSTTYIFANAYYNVGSHYNTSNGIFTAPVAGKYFFSVNLMDETSATHSNSYGIVMKNSGVFQYIYGTNPTAGTHHRFTWAGVIDLAANDTINVNSGNIRWYGAHNDYTYFSGYLLG